MELLSITQTPDETATPAVAGRKYPSMTVRLFLTDALLCVILIGMAVMFSMSSIDSNKLVEQQSRFASMEVLLEGQNNAAFETHVAAYALRDDWANASRETRAELIEKLQASSLNFENNAAKLLANRSITSLKEFESGEDALRQLSDLSKEIMTSYNAGSSGNIRQNVGAELAGNYRFLVGLLNNVEDVIHSKMAVTQLQLAEKSADRSRLVSIGVIIVIVLLALRFALTLRWVVLPARRLADVTTKFANGDTKSKIPVMYASELHQIAKALEVFRNMTIETDELRKRSYDAQKRGHKAQLDLDRRVRNSEELMQQERQKTVSSMAENFETSISNVVEGISTAAQELTVTADQLDRSATGAGDQAQEIAAASAQATTNVQLVASSIAVFSNSVTKISEQLLKAGGMTVSMQKVSDNISETGNSMAQKAVDIDEAANIIVETARKTNAIALKAAIDTSADGDESKFSAVAGEIKELATKTNDCATEIGNVLGALDGELRSNKDMNQHFLASLSKVHDIGTAIRSAVDQQQEMVTEITANASLAATKTQQVNSNISNLAVSVDRASKLSRYMKTAADKFDLQALELEQSAAQFAKFIRA